MQQLLQPLHRHGEQQGGTKQEEEDHHRVTQGIGEIVKPVLIDKGVEKEDVHGVPADPFRGAVQPGDAGKGQQRQQAQRQAQQSLINIQQIIPRAEPQHADQSCKGQAAKQRQPLQGQGRFGIPGFHPLCGAVFR